LPPAFISICLGYILEWGIFRPSGYSTRTVSETSEFSGGFPMPSFPLIPGDTNWGVII
jgi:hypothetical protein